jgi:hypothetical protein
MGGMGTKHAKPDGAHTRRLGRAHLARPPPQRTADALVHARGATQTRRHLDRHERWWSQPRLWHHRGGVACTPCMCGSSTRPHRSMHAFRVRGMSSGCVRLRGERGRAAESRSRPHDDELRPVPWHPPRHGCCRGRRPQAMLYLRDSRPRAAFAGEALSTGAVYTTQGR